MSQLSQQTPPVADVQPVPLHFWHQPIAWLYAFWKFSRPHTIIGTSLSVLALFFIALAETHTGQSRLFALLPPCFPPSALCPLPSALAPLGFLLPALLACLCGNIYIVGLNQLEDVEIDRINKPHLPLASGEFSRAQGQTIVAVTGSLALLLSAWQGVFLLATVWLSLAIGTAYSLPPIRLKRFPVWASLCIFSVRGAIVNLGLFLHFQHRLSHATWFASRTDLTIPATVWVLTLFIVVFTFAIAVFKDIPDLEGDRQYQITTFTIQLGQQAVFNLARWVLTACYSGMILGAALLSKLQAPFLIGTQLAALVALWLLSFRVDLSDQRSIGQFYQFIWKLFFLEYMLFPIACLLAVNSSI